MRPAAGLAEYLAAPLGRYLAGRTWLHFFLDDSLCGLALWGRPDIDQVRGIVAAIDVERPGRCGVHQSLIDARRLTSIDAEAFHEFSEKMAERGAVIGPNVTQHAIVRPRGVLGATVAGFYAVTPTNFPERIRVFDAMPEALRWIGRAAGPVETAIEAMVTAATAVPDALQAVRKAIAESHGKLSLREAARAAGVSPRTLQGQLRAARTSLRAENNAARVQWAQRLLADTDTKITAIALEVGCASLQHFSTLFRKATGVAPSEWRAKRRRAP